MFLLLNSDNSGPNWLADNGTPYAAYYPKNPLTNYADSINDISGNARHIVAGNLPDVTGYTNGVGWTFDGLTYHLILPFGMQETWTIGVKFSNHSGSAGRYLWGAGVSGAAPFNQFQPYVGTIPGTPQFQHGTDTTSTGNGLLSGVIVASDRSLYVDGVLNETLSDTWVSGTTDNIYIGARKVIVASGHINADVEAVIVFDKTLDADEVSVLYDGMELL